MAVSHDTLTPEQRDSLVGLEDLGMRSAARALADLLGEAPALSVASLGVIPRDAAAGLVDPAGGIVAGVAFRLSGGAAGRLVVMLPQAAAFALVASLSRRAVGRRPALAGEELSILKEAGNILGSAYVSAMANRLGVPIMLSIPHLVFDRFEAVLAATLPPHGDGEGARALVATRFADTARQIEGMLLLFPERDGLRAPADGGGGACHTRPGGGD